MAKPRRKHLGHGRPPVSRNKAPRYLVVANGEVTEKQYFEYLNRLLGSCASLVVKAKRMDPYKLAQHASSLVRLEGNTGGDGFEKVFVVTDVDCSTLKQFKDSQALCDKEGFKLVISNPCFEVWLIDHTEPCFLVSKEVVKSRAAQLGLVTGSNNKHLDTSKYDGLLPVACENARKHNTDEKRMGRESLNSLDFASWTDMYAVIDDLGIIK